MNSAALLLQIEIFSDDESDDEEPEDEDEWKDFYMWKDAHAGLKPSPLDGELSDGEMEPDERIAHEDLTARLVEMLRGWEDDDLYDEDWLPASVKKNKRKSAARKKGTHSPNHVTVFELNDT